MIVIESCYNGPPDSGHGGVSAGRFAAEVDARRAAVRLAAPIPVDTPLIVAPLDAGAVEVRSHLIRIATVRPLDGGLRMAPFGRLESHLVRLAERGFFGQPGNEHPFPTCFGCGADRPDGDGLLLAPGRVAGMGLYATHWSPSLDDDVPPWLVWAALDCSSAGPALAAIGSHEVIVTGELSVDIHQPLSGDERYQMIARLNGRDGRKITTEAAAVDERGVNRAVASTTWIVLPRPVMS